MERIACEDYGLYVVQRQVATERLIQEEEKCRCRIQGFTLSVELEIPEKGMPQELKRPLTLSSEGSKIVFCNPWQTWKLKRQLEKTFG